MVCSCKCQKPYFTKLSVLKADFQLKESTGVPQMMQICYLEKTVLQPTKRRNINNFMLVEEFLLLPIYQVLLQTGFFAPITKPVSISEQSRSGFTGAQRPARKSPFLMARKKGAVLHNVINVCHFYLITCKYSHLYWLVSLPSGCGK